MLALAYQLRQNSKFPYFPGVGGWWVKLKIKLLSPAKAGAELGKNAIYSGHLCLCQQPRAAHTLRSHSARTNDFGHSVQLYMNL